MTEPEQDQSLGARAVRIFKRIFGAVFVVVGLFLLVFGGGCLVGKFWTAADVTVGTCLLVMGLGLPFGGGGLHVILYPDKWTGDAHGGGGGG